MSNHTEIFTPQYTERSGPGSTPAFSEPYRAFLEGYFKRRGVENVLDLGCGDMQVMGNVDLTSTTTLGEAGYIGVDCIAERITKNKAAYPRRAFMRQDFHVLAHLDAPAHHGFSFPVTTDAVVCKDVLQHWSTAEICNWLHALQKQWFRFALITNCNYAETGKPLVNSEITTGGWRAIDLLASPFIEELSWSPEVQKVFHWGEPQKDVVMIQGLRWKL